MEHSNSRQRCHYKKCAYLNCELTTRNSTGSISFHSFPVNDTDRCITWLVNSGLDDFVELENSELKKKFICSQHFSKSNFHASGSLRRDAVPKMFEVAVDSDNENSTITTKLCSKKCGLQENRVIELEKQLNKERIKTKMLRLRLQTKCKSLNRLKEKFSSGCIDDACLKKAIAKKVSGFICIFIFSLLFEP